MIVALERAAASVPAGRCAIAVSGGADSVALLRLLHALRRDLALHIVHLDHETRGHESTADAKFVEELSHKLNVSCTVRRISQIHLPAKPKNRSAYFRAARLEFFRNVVEQHQLNGVLLAHHADDQAETVLHRLLRGSGPTGLSGMRSPAKIQSLIILRPLLHVHRQQLRDYLTDTHQAWREDASNASPKYFRNRLRVILQRFPDLTDDLVNAAAAFDHLRRWIRSSSPHLSESFEVGALAELPPLLARESARRWLVDRGCPAGDLSSSILDRLILMASDAASPNRVQFPGGLLVKRKAGRISA